NGSAIVGTIPIASVPAGSNSYVQNNPASQQTAHFNISGNGIVGGRMGIGTTTPTAPLHITKVSTGVTPNANSSVIIDRNASHFINILGPNNEQTGILFGKPNAGANDAGIVYNSDNAGKLQLRTGNSARLTITGDGAITISPQTRHLNLSP